MYTKKSVLSERNDNEQAADLQVKGLHAEYDRLSSQQPKAGSSGKGGEEDKLKAELKAATSRLKEAEVGPLLA